MDSGHAKLDNVRLARNLDVKTTDLEDGLGGKASISEEGIPYVILEFINNSVHPLVNVSRVYLANGNEWPGLSPAELLNYLGRPVAGQFVTKKVKPYLLEDKNGELVLSATYTTFVLPVENELALFAELGYTIVDNNGSVLVPAKRNPLPE
ncbi:hypothetical protein EXU57_09950 [Segetibacter sp. 3557_3]|uniref:hypothetical protein n=1 Tax=Segetibacter sp. 3557_3 TaxID=2547429 RepID=UPI001058F540|nr:hypothetical protein [Segetibacter sp. 3557_3]TDH26412.1 hypothetical protein EXU57_09950 [Segetibacter sp. 3557_3]